MRVALIEDEVPALEHLEALLGQARPGAIVVARLRTVRQLRAWLAANPGGCDLLVADIHLGDGLSLDALAEADLAVPVVFTTAHDAYMAEALQNNGIAYVLKPVQLGDLAAALERLDRLERHFIGGLGALARQLSTPTQRLVGRRGIDWVGVPVESVRWARVRQGTTTAMVDDGTVVMLEDSLNRLQTSLGPAGFFRANRWYLVSMGAITRVRSEGRGRLALVLDPPSDEDVVVPQQQAPAFRAWFGMP